MLISTKAIHQVLVELGERLGFVATREVDDSLLRVRLDEGYRPRVDLMWSLPLDQAEREAIAWATGKAVEQVTHLPVVAIEVEGTTPSTKTLEADVANMTALGAPLSLLVVSEAGESGIYRRAARVVRTVRRAFGDIHVVPVEASWLEPMLTMSWPTGTSRPTARRSGAAGGESLGWSVAAREKIRKVGDVAGFVSVEPLVPDALDLAFSATSAGRSGPLRHMAEPRAGTIANITKASEYLTRSQLDIAWLKPLPAGLAAFLQCVADRDSCLSEHGILFPQNWESVPVVAFELESSGGKHAGGGLLNLAAHSILGVVATPTEETASMVLSTLRTYQPTLGLRNVFVRVLEA